MPAWFLLFLAGTSLLDYQVDEVGKQHLEEGLQKILNRLQKDLTEGLLTRKTEWVSTKLSVDPKETFLPPSPERHSSKSIKDETKESPVGLWRQQSYLAPPQLPHRVNRGTGCQI